MKVIINADDFGANAGINQAIIQSAREGHITSATIMAVGTHYMEAVQAVNDLPDMSFGIHLALTGDFDAVSQDRKLEQCNWNFRRINIFSIPKIIKEFSAQIQKLQSAGLKISHIDSHQHIQLYPIVLVAIAFVAHKYKIKKVRSQKMVEKKSLPNQTCRFLHHTMGRVLGLKQCDYYTDFISFEERLSELVSQDTLVEVMCHPGGKYNDERYFNEEFYRGFSSKLTNYNTI